MNEQHPEILEQTARAEMPTGQKLVTMVMDTGGFHAGSSYYFDIRHAAALIDRGVAMEPEDYAHLPDDAREKRLRRSGPQF